MRKSIKVIVLAALFSFAWGAWWGLYSLEKTQPRKKRGPTVRVLAIKNFFTPAFLADFQKRENTQIALTEKDSEIDVLREALSRAADYDLIQINSFISKSFIVDNIFSPLKHREVPRLQNVSIDFKNLEFDPENRYLVPLSWGLNGFLVDGEKVSLSAETLEEIFNAKAKVSLLPSPIELFNLAVKMKPIIKAWVETGQTNELQNDMKDLRSRLALVAKDPRLKIRDGSYQIGQMTNGQAAKLVGSGSVYRFVLPKERATLWLNLIGVSRGARDIEFAHRIVNELLDVRTNQRLIELSEQASVLDTLNNSNLPLLQKAAFLRQVPLSRVDFFINQDALEPTWLQFYRKEWGESQPPQQQ